MSEFIPATLRNCFGKVRVFRKINEILKGGCGCPLFALEQHRNIWRKNKKPGRDFCLFQIQQLNQSLAGRSVTNLVVVLRVDDERISFQLANGSTMTPLSKTGETSVKQIGLLQHSC